MTISVLAALTELSNQKPGKNGYTRTQVQKVLSGSEGAEVMKRLQILSGVTVEKLARLLNEPEKPVEPPEPRPEAPSEAGGPGSQAPSEPPNPGPVKIPEPETGRSLLNEQVFTDTSGNRLNAQNDGKPGSLEYLGDGHYRARLPAAINGVIQGQRPSERVPKSTKRRSEISGIKVASPVGDQVVSVKCRYRFRPQDFAANQQWVMPFQLHGAGKTGSPWFAVRIEKGGWWLATVCLSPTGSSISCRPHERFKPDPNVWHESEVRWSSERVEFFHNGKMVAEYDGRIGWDEEGVPYLKFLIYNAQGSHEETEVEVVDLTVNGKPAGILV